VKKETKLVKKHRAQEVFARLEAMYGTRPCPLIFGGDPFKLTIATLLSAQTTDARVNEVTPKLWEKYPSIESLAAANVNDVEDIIRSIGFYHVKAANCIKCAQMLLDEFDGVVPQTIDELTKLPGVGRKTANVVMAEAFGIADGIAVDTHVYRCAKLLGLSSGEDPSHVEKDLCEIFAREQWIHINRRLVLFGREVCIARRPKCDTCPMIDICPSVRIQ
jgi:endonuclease III